MIVEILKFSISNSTSIVKSICSVNFEVDSTEYLLVMKITLDVPLKYFQSTELKTYLSNSVGTTGHLLGWRVCGV